MAVILLTLYVSHPHSRKPFTLTPSFHQPTTTIYSITDEIVVPQSGLVASAIIKDARRVGVSNSELQDTCALAIGGLYATHEGMLYNPLAYALAVDALTHDGPGNPKRLDLFKVCNELVSPGLTVVDVIAAESTFYHSFSTFVCLWIRFADEFLILGNIIIALVATLFYIPKRILEPAIRGYAWFD
jgi:hypothetical protein